MSRKLPTISLPARCCLMVSSIIPTSGGKCFQTVGGFLLCSRLPFRLWPRRKTSRGDETDETSFCALQILFLGLTLINGVKNKKRSVKECSISCTTLAGQRLKLNILLLGKHKVVF